MEFNGFKQEDFDVFLINGLDARMDILKEKIRPKLEYLGQFFAPSLAALTGDEMYIHVAKHARRTVNPPKETWVALANNPRGYKMMPHFQIGLWNTHLFIWFAVIYEAPQKEEFGKRFEKKINKIYKDIPKNFFWSLDHTKPETTKHSQLSKEDLQVFFHRLQTVKKAEILCGSIIQKDEAMNMGGKGLLNHIENVFLNVAPLYKIAFNNK